METVMPSPPVDFNFDSACTTPYISAPSSPPHFGAGFASAPGSPTRFLGGGAVPFSWEEKPGVPKPRRDFDGINGEYEDDDRDFVFEFSGPLEKAYLSAADELFDSGKIKPLKPPSLRPEHGEKPRSSPKFPDKTVKEVRRSQKPENDADKRGRGREIRSNNNPRHKATRSLSPFRASDLVFDRKQTGPENTNNNSAVSSSFISTMLSGRWKLKDLLLFRSASEDSEGSGSISRRRGPVSAHELHYTMNRTISEELRRKTFLPYKQGLLGCLGFNPAVHEMSCRGFASVSMPRS
nr:herbivore elicitor-regulated 1 [Ipomoea batatas]